MACGRLTELFKVWAGELIDGGNPRDIGQGVRALRKNLTPLVFDPRGEYGVQRVASAYILRGIEHHDHGAEKNSTYFRVDGVEEI